MNKSILRTTSILTDICVREQGKKSRTITGYSILFNTPSTPLYSDEANEVREVIDPSAISYTLLKESDIKMLLFHDRQLLLARSNKGNGTLQYSISKYGVSFAFDAPHTADGDKALELVRRGDITGCSFAFSTCYYDRDFVERTSTKKGGKTLIACRVKKITGVYDFSLASDPAYPDTSAEAREFGRSLVYAKQVEEMRAAANREFL